MKKQKGFIIIEFFSFIVLALLAYLVVYFAVIYKQEEFKVYEGKFENIVAYTLNNERNFCAVKFSGIEIKNIDLTKCLFLDINKEYRITFNQFYFETIELKKD